jgi:acetolactate synthase I/II/III large subunit
VKYSDQLAIWLRDSGYTHCFYVGGGNIMHLVESFTHKLECIPVIHEVAAAIAAEYFNETSEDQKALALVTAGPGLTNAVTGISGAFLESRELLVIGGQVKTTDLSRGELRQRGIQEIDGVSIVKAITKKAELMDSSWTMERVHKFINTSSHGRPGPVFLEIPIDIQAREVDYVPYKAISGHETEKLSKSQLNSIQDVVSKSKRPVILLGGGVQRKIAKKLLPIFDKLNIPVATTWNGADRIGASSKVYIGRPNTWGQRSSNICIQQADLLLAFGTRLGIQQTGFNWQEFMPVGEIIQFDIDESEIKKSHPKITKGFAVEASCALEEVLKLQFNDTTEWLDFCNSVRKKVPLIEKDINKVYDDYASPHQLVQSLSRITTINDIIIPCSSGGAFTTMMQVFEQKAGQKIVTNKGLASMGYGLSGAIGAATANPTKRVILVEGDGGFAQNIQEIGTAVINGLNIKLFIFDDSGYASIRMTQRSYFSGKYVGCDVKTGLGLPSWQELFKAWGCLPLRLDSAQLDSDPFLQSFETDGFQAYIVRIHSEQTYYPKIQSRVLSDGSMKSNPIHNMTPSLSSDVSSAVFKYIEADLYE